MLRRIISALPLSIVCLAATAGPAAAGPQDTVLRPLLARYGVTPVDPGPVQEPWMVELGRNLYFDKVLSGNRDLSCATCHHPATSTGDALPLSIGVMGSGLGPGRTRDPHRPFIPRNSPEVFNRGTPSWHTAFADGRLINAGDGFFFNPAGDQLPPGLRGTLAAQAMFPVTSRDEMRGEPGDPYNELAAIPDDDFRGIWAALMNRLMSIPEYRDLFAAAYPGVAPEAMGFEHAANALAAFEAAAYTRLDSPFDLYLMGHNGALTPEQKQGAILFFGKAGCASCHNGPLLSDQLFHNILVPQFGPGKAPEAPLDLGRARVTGDPRDAFKFRTPPLRNVAETGPYMHNGAYDSLGEAVRHHLDPVGALHAYDGSDLPPELRATLVKNRTTLDLMARTADPRLARGTPLADAEAHAIVLFLRSLSSSSLGALDDVIPERVPSGLPVER